ncbi:MAG: NAD(P)H-dependent oxidoreductase [Anaerolineae bacterium]
MKLLHIVATPRNHTSHTRRVSDAFLAYARAKHPDLNVEVVDLFNQDLPSIAGENIESKYELMYGQKIDKRHEESWKQIELQIEHFLSADLYLITTPMWNFGIPYALKFYIDAIVQPGYLFKYNEMGQAIGLVAGRKMICVTSRGGDYSAGTPFHAYDFQEPYLRAIFGFVGITDMQFVNAQPMDVTTELREVATAAAIEQAKRIVDTMDWSVKPAAEKENPLTLKPRVLVEG